MKRSLQILLLVIAGTACARSESAQDTSYGQDPVPDSQFWSGTLSQGYGLDLVPAQAEIDRPYRKEYGVDPIPNSRIYDNLDSVAPQFSQPEQVLTGATEDESRPAPITRPPRRQR
jgi:hypothetical protein